MKRKSLFVVLALALCLVLLLSGCSNPFKKKAPDKNLPTVNLKDLEGVYSEILAKRGVLQFTARDENSANIVINWPGSYNERAHWEMTGTYDAEKQAIVYSNAQLIEQTFADDGTQSDRQVSTNGTGSFRIDGTSLVWTDDNAYVGSDPTTFTWQMSLGDYMKTVPAAPTPAPTPIPTPAATPAPAPAPTPTPVLKEKLPPEPGCPIVTKDPTDETVKVGGNAYFVAKYNNANLARWHFVSPDGTTDVQYDEAGKLFPGVEIIHGEYSTMQLRNITKDLNGWKVYCRYSNRVGYTDTEMATITVTD